MAPGPQKATGDAHPSGQPPSKAARLEAGADAEKPAEPAEPSRCVVCAGPGDFYGSGQWASVAYCHGCWEAWLAEPEDTDGDSCSSTCRKPAPAAGACAECGGPGEFTGSNAYSGFSYCTVCWLAWLRHEEGLNGVYEDQWSVGTKYVLTRCGSLVHVTDPQHSFDDTMSIMPDGTLYMWHLTATLRDGVITWENGGSWVKQDASASSVATAAVPAAPQEDAGGVPPAPGGAAPLVAPRRCAQCERPGRIPGSGVFFGQVYCDDCWASYQQANPRPATTPPSSADQRTAPKSDGERACSDVDSWNVVQGRRSKASKARHYDFIEIGTSDWGTLTQFCAGDTVQGSMLARWIKSENELHKCRGLAVDAVKEHVQALPDLPGVKLVSAAMDEFSGEDVLYYVPTDDIDRYMGRYHAALVETPPGEEASLAFGEVDVMWYAKSLSCLGKPQVELECMLRRVGRLDLLKRRKVRVLNWGDLCRQYKVRSVDVVQLDCEGKDCAILRGLLEFCSTRPEAFPRVIQFESNHLNDPQEVGAIVDAFRQNGYVVTFQNDRNTIVERSAAN